MKYLLLSIIDILNQSQIRFQLQILLILRRIFPDKTKKDLRFFSWGLFSMGANFTSRPFILYNILVKSTIPASKSVFESFWSGAKSDLAKRRGNLYYFLLLSLHAPEKVTKEKANPWGFFDFSNFVIIRQNLGLFSRLRTFITHKKNYKKCLKGYLVYLLV